MLTTAIEQFDTSSIKHDDYIVFGGTFDPPHLGHLSVVASLAPIFHRVILAPTGQNPWKKGSVASYDARLSMLREILRYEQIPFSEELNQEGIILLNHPYERSKDLALYLREQLKGTQYWAVGADSAQTVQHWHDWQALNITTITLPITISIHSTTVRHDPSSLHPALRRFAPLYSGASHHHKS